MENGELRAELKRIEQRFIDFKETHAIEHGLLKEQLVEYKEMVRAKHLEMNEVRRQINDERGQFEIREHSDARIDAVNDRVTRMENAYSGLNGRLLGLGTGLTVLMVLIEIAFKLWKQ